MINTAYASKDASQELLMSDATSRHKRLLCQSLSILRMCLAKGSLISV